MSSDPDLEELREQSRPGQRTDRTSDADDESMEEQFVDALQAVEEGGSNMKTLSARDEDLAAFVRGLERDEDELKDVVTQVQEARGKGDEVNRQELIIAATWVGLKEVCPDVVEAFADAKREQAGQV